MVNTGKSRSKHKGKPGHTAGITSDARRPFLYCRGEGSAAPNASAVSPGATIATRNPLGRGASAAKRPLGGRRSRLALEENGSEVISRSAGALRRKIFSGSKLLVLKIPRRLLEVRTGKERQMTDRG